MRDTGNVSRSNQVEQMYPALAKWVNGYGHVEIGDQDGFGRITRALDYGGLIFEDEGPTTLGESLAALESALARWFESEGIEVGG